MGTDRTRVVVTGLGAITPLGADVASTWESMLAGRSGVRQLTDDWAAELPARIAALGGGRSGHPDRPGAGPPAGPLRAVRAGRGARGLGATRARPRLTRSGSASWCPAASAASASTLSAYDTLKEKGWQRLSPFTVPMLMPNGSAGWIASSSAPGPACTRTVSACASGAEAIGYAMDMIRSGRADVVLAGGTEAAIIQLNIAAFAAMRALSTRNDEPERASRPFDKGRDGFVLGEGAGMVVLESEEHAAARGATRVCRRGRRRLLLRRAPHRPARPGGHRR